MKSSKKLKKINWFINDELAEISRIENNKNEKFNLGYMLGRKMAFDDMKNYIDKLKESNNE